MQLRAVLLVAVVVWVGHAKTPSPPSTLDIPTLANPTFECSAFCMYEITSGYLLSSLCTQNYNVAAGAFGNGHCTKCDPLFFRLEGTFCVPHEYNSERVVDYSLAGLQMGYYQDLSADTWVGDQIKLVSGIVPHWALRVRFSIYLHNYGYSGYEYPIQYNIDSNAYSYEQLLDKYFSSYDIVTSPQVKHSDTQVQLSFRLEKKDWPINLGVGCWYGFYNGDCLCPHTYSDTCSGGGPYTACYGASSVCYTPVTSWATNPNCCDLRYVRISDLIVFAAVCQTGCYNCTSSTNCLICDNPSINPANALIYYRYPADNRCYTTCPQTTFPEATSLFNTTAWATSTTVEYLCSSCPATCLECTSLLVCTKCFYAGRNESFLFNTQCVLSCPLTALYYQGNFTTHVCECPAEHFYEAVQWVTCTPCAIECVRCSGPTNLQCSYCEKGYYLALGTTYCLLECPDGQYKSDLTRACLACDPSCSSCKQESTLCTKCFITTPPHYLLGQECLTWCPAGYSWNNVTYRCEECDFYTYSLNGRCVQFCPTMYEANAENKSCIHLSKTGFTFNLALISVSILDHGKLLKLEVLAQDGLNSASYDAIMKRSYFNAQVLYKDEMLTAVSGVRALLNANLPIRNVQYINNKIYYYVQLPDNLDFHKSFQVIFNDPLAGSQGISYNNFTNAYPVYQHPELIKQYFLFAAKSNFNVLLIAFIALIFFLFTLQLKGVYELFMELLRVAQVLGLLVYSAFPVGPSVFYFLIGCSYANLDFIPNLYAMAAKPETVKNFSSYSLMADDMDFIRLNGSVLFFAVIWTVVVLIAKCLFKVKENRLEYLARFGIDLMEVKILHSFWSSLVFIVINYTSTNFSVFVTFAFAFVLFLATIARRYAIWKEDKDISPFFVWRAVGTLLVCFIALSNELLISLLFCVAVGATIWEFYVLHSSKYLIDIAHLNSTNYMNEKTFKILNNYDEEVGYSWAISIRNTIITMLPVAAALFAAVLILLKEAEYEVIIFTTVLLYFFLLIVIVNAVLIYNFLDERRKYLVQNKLEFLQKKYAKLNNNETAVYEERKRPRVPNSAAIFDEEKFLENPARAMMKNLD